MYPRQIFITAVSASFLFISVAAGANGNVAAQGATAAALAAGNTVTIDNLPGFKGPVTVVDPDAAPAPSTFSDPAADPNSLDAQKQRELNHIDVLAGTDDPSNYAMERTDIVHPIDHSVYYQPTRSSEDRMNLQETMQLQQGKEVDDLLNQIHPGLASVGRYQGNVLNHHYRLDYYGPKRCNVHSRVGLCLTIDLNH